MIRNFLLILTLFSTAALGQIVNPGGGGGGGAVSSVFGRTGAVVAAANDYTFDQIGSGTNLGHGLVCGAGCVISATGGGFINANEINGTLLSFTNNRVPKGNSTNSLVDSSISDDATTVTTTNTGGWTGPSFTANGTTAGFVAFGQGTDSGAIGACANANTICDEAPTSVTSYKLIRPSAAASGLMTWTNASGTVTESVTALGTGIAAWLTTPSSANLITAMTDETGTGALAFATSPTLVTPVLGVAAATTINKVAITAPATSATLTLVQGSTLTLNGAFNTQFTGSANATFTLPGATDTLVGLTATQTLTNKTMTAPVLNTVNITNGTITNVPIGATTANTGKFTTLTGTTLNTTTNCSSAASPAVCAAAASGSVVVAAASTTVVVNTTAVTANSQIYVQEDASLGTKLTVTCNTLAATAPPTITARTAATSFTITTTVPTTNPRCFSYTVVN